MLRSLSARSCSVVDDESAGRAMNESENANPKTPTMRPRAMARGCSPIRVANTSSAELRDAPPTAGALGKFAAIEQREQGRVDPSGVVADGSHGCTHAIVLAWQQQLV